MAKPTSIKEALARWQEEHNAIPLNDAQAVELQFQWPPIEKMDNNLGELVKCEKLSLSTNMIKKISGLSGLNNLKVLSLARNYIKTLDGIEVLGNTLEELWLSYNQIERLKGIEAMQKLKVLYIANNMVKDWGEFNKIASTPVSDLLFLGNPLVESLDEASYHKDAMRRLPLLRKLDGHPLLRD